MPFKDKEKQKEYQKVWMRKRRLQLLENKLCYYCQSNNNLTFVNIKTQGKKFSISYKKEILDQKINDSMILCDTCFIDFDKNRKKKRNTKHGHSKSNSLTYTTWRCMLDSVIICQKIIIDIMAVEE